MYKPKNLIRNFLLISLSVFALAGTASAATITVDTTADTIASDGACSLREAITNSNGDTQVTAGVGECNPGSGTDDINFSIGTGLQTIVITSELPTITTPVNLNATTQPGTQSCTDKDLLIELEADLGLVDTSGFVFGAGATGSTVTGFIINGFVNDADVDNGAINNAADNLTVTCNILGLNESGAASPNSYGINSTGNGMIVGGSNPGEGNVISGNSLDGIRFIAGDNNQVIGNLIGLNIAGDTDLGNGTYGVRATSVSTNNTYGPGNVISGNNSGGLNLDSSSQTVIGNIIGLNQAGDAEVPNGFGIFTDSSSITIGGDTPAERNIISGNNFPGIDARGGTQTGLVVQGNYIGTSVDGLSAFPNGSQGVVVESINPLIGGSNAGEGNLISGNEGDGVFLRSDSDTAEIYGNIIGLDVNGDQPLPNTGEGVYSLRDSVTIGGPTLLQRNIISSNGANGIYLSSDNSIVQNNYIGTTADGLSDRGNTDDGVYQSFGDNNLIGGPNAGEGNLISGNGGLGMAISNATIQGNIIGLNQTGDAAIANDLGGVTTANSVVGGDTASERNIISGNGGVGITANGTTTTVTGNYIGTSVDGLNAVPNTSAGLSVTGDTIQIGGLNAGEENIISGNSGPGIRVIGDQHSIIGNIIGISADGSALGNETFGIQVLQQSEFQNVPGEGFILVDIASDQITIGGTTVAHANIISANGVSGVFVGEENTNTSIIGNFIGTDASGNIVDGGLLSDPLGNGRLGSAGEDSGGIIAKSSSSVNIGNFDGTGANVIAGNFGPGIVVSQNTTLPEEDVTILSNSIFGNSDIGIDLSNDTNDDGFSDDELGATTNDTNDADSGANGLLNFINLKAKTDNGADFTIDYTLDVPAGDYVVQFYENTTADPTNFGEGETLADSVSITHGGTGEESFSSTIVLSDASNLVATVTEDLGGGTYGATSEFSSNQILVATTSGGGGGSNGSSSSPSEVSNPFQQTETTTPQGQPRECSYEQALKEIEQFRGFEREVSRYEALEYVLLINCIGLDELPEDPNDYPFSDINLESERLARVLYTGYNRGIVKGYPDGTYKPANTVNYVELLAINARAQNLANDSNEAGEQWFSSYLNLGLTIQLALNNVGFGDPIEGKIFYLITKTFLDSSK